MAKQNPYRPFEPCDAQKELIPEISGNDINGLGEGRVRRARYVYWNDPDTLAHGEMQRWFYQNDPENETLKEAREERARVTGIALPEIATQRAARSATEWTRLLKKEAGGLDFEMNGITALKPDYLFEGCELDHEWVIMIGVVHDYDEISCAPKDRAGAEVVRQYGRAMRGALELAGWVRRQGYDAEAHTGPLASKLMMIPPAIAAGLGELGKHGSLINREYGSSFRLSAVTTSMPLDETGAPPLWVDDFCENCRICEDACPPQAIFQEKQLVRGERKWYVDFDKCIPFFNETFGCAMCIAQCPWSRPGVGPRLADKLSRRKERLEAPGA
ncbi:MAG: 4Fe-4S dicluster domain-containing protein [Hyphomicrobiales bacterium]